MSKLLENLAAARDALEEQIAILRAEKKKAWKAVDSLEADIHDLENRLMAVEDKLGPYVAVYK